MGKDVETSLETNDTTNNSHNDKYNNHNDNLHHNHNNHTDNNNNDDNNSNNRHVYKCRRSHKHVGLGSPLFASSFVKVSTCEAEVRR